MAKTHSNLMTSLCAPQMISYVFSVVGRGEEKLLSMYWYPHS